MVYCISYEYLLIYFCNKKKIMSTHWTLQRPKMVSSSTSKTSCNCSLIKMLGRTGVWWAESKLALTTWFLKDERIPFLTFVIHIGSSSCRISTLGWKVRRKNIFQLRISWMSFRSIRVTKSFQENFESNKSYY